MAWIQMRDLWTFRPTEVQENKKHLFECKDSKSDTGHSLLVHVAATHSGIVNGNRRFYRPDKMQESVHTWLPEKASDGTVLRTARPVLIGHDEKGDVLGRVLEAKYIDESWKYANDFPVVKDFLFYQRDGRKRKNLFDSVDWVVDNLAPLDEYTGLGYTDLGLRVTNPDAIRKVFNDEYLTVSVGFKTDAAVCSVCHTDWATDGKCEHKLGQKVDGRPMFLITGSLVNEEVSFVNFPADPFATTLSKKVLTDSLEKLFFLGLPITQQNTAIADGLRLTDGLLYEADLMAATEDSMEAVIDITKLDLTAVAAELKSKDLTKERAKSLKDAFASWTPETDEDKSTKRSLVSTVNAKIQHNKWNDATAVTTEDATVAEELRSLMQDSQKTDTPVVATDATAFEGWDDWTASTDEDRDYFADLAGVAGEIAAVVGSDAAADLAADVFCGPFSTFPVTDATYAAAARKVLETAKMSDAVKNQILNNISFKEKNFAAIGKEVVDTNDTTAVDNVSKPAEATTGADAVDLRVEGIVTTALLKDEAATLTQDQRNALVEAIKSLDKAYDALGKDGPQWALRYAIRAMLSDWDADGEFASALAYIQGKDHVVLSVAELAEKDEAINGLTTERDELTTELASVRDSRNLILASAKKSMATQIVMHNVLKGQDGFANLTPAETAEKIEQLSKRHAGSLKDSVSDILVGLKFIDSKPAAETSSETAAVDDHTKITDEAPAEVLTDAKSEADKAQEVFLHSLRFLSPAERARRISRMRFTTK